MLFGMFVPSSASLYTMTPVVISRQLAKIRPRRPSRPRQGCIGKVTLGLSQTLIGHDISRKPRTCLHLVQHINYIRPLFSAAAKYCQHGQYHCHLRLVLFVFFLPSPTSGDWNVVGEFIARSLAHLGSKPPKSSRTARLSFAGRVRRS